MTQTPRRSTKKLLELDDHALMEKIVGKRVMKALDKVVAEHSDDPDDTPHRPPTNTA